MFNFLLHAAYAVTGLLTGAGLLLLMFGFRWGTFLTYVGSIPVGFFTLGYIVARMMGAK